VSRPTVRRLEAALPAASVVAYSGSSRANLRIGSQPATRVTVQVGERRFFSDAWAGAVGGAPARGARRRARRSGERGRGVRCVGAGEFRHTGDGGRKEISVNQLPVAVVGVLPESFHDIVIGQRTELWLPAAVQDRLHFFGNASTTAGDDRPNDPDWNREERVSWPAGFAARAAGGFRAGARGATRVGASARFGSLLTFSEPKERELLRHKGWIVEPSPGGRSGLRGSFRSTGWLLGGVVAVMLVLVCTNVSGLLLVRSMSRHREIGIRLALGAGAWRVVQLGLFEAVQLSLLGASGGTLLAIWLLPAATRLLAPGQGRRRGDRREFDSHDGCARAGDGDRERAGAGAVDFARRAAERPRGHARARPGAGAARAVFGDGAICNRGGARRPRDRARTGVAAVVERGIRASSENTC